MKDGSYAVSVGTCSDAHIVIPENYNGKPMRVITQWDANSNYFVVHCTDGDIKKGVYS
jgi:hypothetical protein